MYLDGMHLAGFADLQQGARGPAVAQLQQALISRGYDVGPTGADGIFGSNTAWAVESFQYDAGLVIDGIAGPATMGALGLAISTPGAPTPTPAPAPGAPAPSAASTLGGLPWWGWLGVAGAVAFLIWGGEWVGEKK